VRSELRRRRSSSTRVKHSSLPPDGPQDVKLSEAESAIISEDEESETQDSFSTSGHTGEQKSALAEKYGQNSWRIRRITGRPRGGRHVIETSLTVKDGGTK
jgi:hypothetical protein